MRPESRGFTLLEAIVAMAILAAAGLALFAAMSQSLQMVQRAQRAQEDDRALRNALAWGDRINPMQQPTGEQDLGSYMLRWDAEPVERPRDGDTGFLQPSLYEVGLYRLHMALWRDGSIAREATFNRAGYRQVRKPAQL